ncbi:rCG31255 [Rattus norvegicus]|uniref:RCG31255 n=1 Tax=Rattus norvegicus TaxID=10116 RepID=A6IUP7_RAT|nr:rCG31255 [Rattus norvegicus]
MRFLQRSPRNGLDCWQTPSGTAPRWRSLSNSPSKMVPRDLPLSNDPSQMIPRQWSRNRVAPPHPRNRSSATVPQHWPRRISSLAS